MRRHHAVRLAALALVAVTASGALRPATADPGQFAGRPDEPTHRRIVFPIAGGASYSDTWHAPRSGGRLHKGQDLFAPKMRQIVAVADGRVSWLRIEEEGVLSGRMLTLTDEDGWSYRYIHLNNDNPGTDDGAAPRHLTVLDGIDVGTRVKAGQPLGYVGDSGNAEGTAPHIHFEMLTPSGEQFNPMPSLAVSQGRPYSNLCRFNSNPKPAPSARSGPGYYVLDQAGGVFGFGHAPYKGSVPGLRAAATPVGPATLVGMAPTRSGRGYWMVDDVGGVFAFGNASFKGSVPALRAAGHRIGQATIVDLVPTASGGGYWLVDDAGGVFAFGDAPYLGSVPELRGAGHRIGLSTVVSMVPTPSGKGYWMLDEVGGVFTFGDARYYGSVPGLRAEGRSIGPSTVVAMAPTRSGHGYWMVDRSGGVFGFGDARYYGSVPGVGLCRTAPVSAFGASATGRGYWMVGEDGRVWTFGDARYLGGVDRLPTGRARVVDLDVTPSA